MTYGIHLVRREQGQSWSSALSAREATSGERRSLPADLTRAWPGIAARAAEILGGSGIRVLESDRSRQLTHEDTGIQFTVSPNEAAITVPYRHHGQSADRVLNHIHALAALIERETDLEAYDPQSDKPLAEVPLHQAAALMSETSGP